MCHRKVVILRISDFNTTVLMDGFRNKSMFQKSVQKDRRYEIIHFLVTIWVDENYPSCADVLKLSNMLRTHQTNESIFIKILPYTQTDVYLQTGVSQNENESWTIDQFFFRKWPDHDIPQHAEYILNFIHAIKSMDIKYPVVVHCSAGVGRTGTYICIDILLNEMLSGEAIDVLACVTKLREERMHMVQKRIQLEFIYDVLVENILTGDYDIDVSNIPEEFSRIKETDNSSRVSILEHQFQSVLTSNPENILCKVFTDLEYCYNISSVI
ncbi:receptor-type tyrosine-protein phosphatase epsilon-like [Octopus sinensis]|uniref:Receptor-type tyrosine-protein phosphatase epsilon-like n=1 Tax=Octopus sinensis TaxID=2607531 RepID=A0A7E6FC30_9MOLL|nr:receptor-type tyrosine-protein phosphatase epsilon-like [Octopus sinensis]